MDSPPNVATPFTMGWVRVPDSVPPPGFVPMARVIVPEFWVRSEERRVGRAWSGGEGEVDTPATALVGCWAKARWLSALGVMLNAVDVVVRMEWGGVPDRL